MKQSSNVVLLFIVCIIGLASSALYKSEYDTENYQGDFGFKASQTFDARPYLENLGQSISALSIAAKRATIKWSRSFLTYSVQSYPRELNESTTRNRIREAFKTWFDHIPLTIEETCATCPSDIVIQFVSNEESDEMDGRLLNAYFPEDGRLIFDKDQMWTDGLVLFAASNIRLGGNPNFNPMFLEKMMYD